MASILQNNPTSYRSCILYEVKLGRSVEDAYKNMCKATENDKIDYVDFEYWFYRFYHGNFDLDHDRSSDPEPLSISNLPMEMLGEIVSKLDLVSRLITRKVFRVLPNVVDKQKIHHKWIAFRAYPNYIEIQFDHNTIHYKNNDDVPIETNAEYTIIDDDFERIAVNDFAIAVKNPKLQSRQLDVILDKNANTANEMILNVFESSKDTIHVKYVKTRHSGDKKVLSILSSLKPGSLESIDLYSMNKNADMSQIVKAEQWKRAKEGSIDGPPVNIKDFLHFKYFDCQVESISQQDVIHIRDTLSKSTNFEYCWLTILHDDLDIDDIGRALGVAVVQDEDDRVIDHRYQIPESNDFLDFKIDAHSLIIEKTR